MNRVQYKFEYIDQFGNSTMLHRNQNADMIDDDVVSELGNLVENVKDFLAACGFHPDSIENYINIDGLANAE